MKKILAVLLLLILAINVSFCDENGEAVDYSYEKAKVLSVTDRNYIENGEEYLVQLVDLEIISGDYKGEKATVENGLSGNFVYKVESKPGMELIVAINDSAEDLEVIITDYSREKYIKWVLILFVAVLLLVGKSKGLKTLITLATTILLIIKFMIPFMLKGYNPIILAIVTAIIITNFTLYFVAGVNKKSFSAIIGTTFGVVISGIIAYIIGLKANMTGLSGMEAGMLMYIPQGVTFDYRGILFAGIILGSLGAVMDVAMSISSSISELYSIDDSLSAKRLFKSGMNVGRDIMGTMANTLILAYTGGSLQLMMIFMAYSTPARKIFNLDIISTEIIRSLAGSMGLILTIPITAAITVFFIKKVHID
jgi:uncharacterized membrane protein